MNNHINNINPNILNNTENIADQTIQKRVKSIIRHCDYCNFDAHSPTEWIKHVETKKHQRKGAKLSDNLVCDICGLISINTFNHNVHQILVHGTPEDRRTKAKFYCEDCDKGFFCKLYHDKHVLTKRHHNMVKYNQLIKEESDLIKQDQNKQTNIILDDIPDINQLLEETDVELIQHYKLLEYVKKSLV